MDWKPDELTLASERLVLEEADATPPREAVVERPSMERVYDLRSALTASR